LNMPRGWIETLLSQNSSVAGVITAGGKASRMGGEDKGRLRVGGQAILSRVINTLRPQVSTLLLNANGDGARFADLDLDIKPDDPRGAGPLAGLLAGLEWAAQIGCPWLLSVPTDTPFLPADLRIRLAVGLREPTGAAIARSAGRNHPVIGLWSTALAGSLRRFLIDQGELRATRWAQYCGAAIVDWPDDPVDPFFNVNTPDDRMKAEHLASLSIRRAGAVVLPAGRDAYRLLHGFVTEARRRGLPIGGLLQQGGKSIGTPPAEVMMLALDTGQSFPIMQRLGRHASCAADTQQIALASVALRRAIEQRREPILVNKFGALEAEGGGLIDEMLNGMAEGLPLLTTVSTERLAAWLACCGGLCELLPADPDALWSWWERQSPQSA